MNFIDTKSAAKKAELKALHFDFKRSEDLHKQMKWLLSDFWSKAANGERFEARGLMVTGPSRVGKSDEIASVLKSLNSGDTLMPDGRPARIVSVMLSGTMSWKNLGVRTLTQGMGLPVSNRATQQQIWELVAFQARERGIVGIHYDECQHIFPKIRTQSHAMLLDSFKTLLKNPTWPMMLILSGVDELADHLNAEEQLAFLLRSVRFRKIDLSEKADVAELNRLCFAYADHAEFDFSKFSNMDFYRRLALACSNRWGLVIELLIEALVDAISSGSQELTSDIFCRAFTDTLSLQPGFSPFSIEDYQSVFEAEKLLDLWMRKDSPK